MFYIYCKQINYISFLKINIHCCIVLLLYVLSKVYVAYSSHLKIRVHMFFTSEFDCKILNKPFLLMVNFYIYSGFALKTP